MNGHGPRLCWPIGLISWSWVGPTYFHALFHPQKLAQEGSNLMMATKRYKTDKMNRFNQINKSCNDKNTEKRTPEGTTRTMCWKILKTHWSPGFLCAAAIFFLSWSSGSRHVLIWQNVLSKILGTYVCIVEPLLRKVPTWWWQHNKAAASQRKH